jgi:endonuclease YncB( thermonuclease family)
MAVKKTIRIKPQIVMTAIRLLLAGLLLGLAALSHAQGQYIVTKVYDGDTVELDGEQGKFKLRLTDIDAPERNQAYGKISRRALNKLCKASNIKVSAKILGTDKYHRALGRLQCNGMDASLYMAAHGFAWHYEKYSSDATIRQASATARTKRIGLWQESNPTPPWLWRKQHPNFWREYPQKRAGYSACTENPECEN